MIITKAFDQLPPGPRTFVLGNFDGVHLGHQALFAQALSIARHHGGPAIAFAFDPHPLKVLGHPVASITTEEQKARLIAANGMSAYYTLPFTKEVATMHPQAFVEDILIKQARAQSVVVGFNYSFGRQAIGTPEYLRDAMRPFNISVEIVPPVVVHGEAVSSTRVRQHIRQGEFGLVQDLLGRPYCLAGRVAYGDQRGRSMGFPTANIYKFEELILPPFGVYAAYVKNLGYGMANLGFRPSFPQAGPSLEVHLFDFDADLYNQYIEVELLSFVRAETRFTSLTELSAQLVADQVEIRRLVGI